MKTTIDSRGRVLLSISVRRLLGWRVGMPLDVSVEDGTVRLTSHMCGHRLVRRKSGLLVAHPRVRRADLPTIDVAALIDRERHHDY